VEGRIVFIWLPRFRRRETVVGDVGVERSLRRSQTGPGVGILLPAIFADADEIAVCRRDEDLVGGVEVFGTKRLLQDGNAGFRRDFT